MTFSVRPSSTDVYKMYVDFGMLSSGEREMLPIVSMYVRSICTLGTGQFAVCVCPCLSVFSPCPYCTNDPKLYVL